MLEAASICSPAAIYRPPAAAVRDLDQPHRRVVEAITSSAQTVQPLQLHPGAHKAATLTALADTAHHHNSRILALPATEAATEYAAHNRYADTTTTPDNARTKLENKRWKLSLGSCAIVDDADHLQCEQLRWLSETAAATNTKLIPISNADSRQPGSTLLSVLANNLPSAQHLGTPDPHRQLPPNAIQRVEHHLAVTNATSTTRNEATQLLHQRDQILDRLREIADTAPQIDTATARSV